MILFEQFNSEIVVNLIYILAAMLFIFGLKMLGSPETARKGNLTSASGMFLAVVVTLLDQSIIDFSFLDPNLSDIILAHNFLAVLNLAIS